jgi:hypothetical protein
MLGRLDLKGTTMLSTGLPTLDQRIGGLRHSQLAAIAGNLQMEFALNVVEQIGVRSGHSVLFCTGGTPQEQIADRLACCHAGVDPAMVSGGQLDPASWDKLRDAAQSLYDSAVFVEDLPMEQLLEFDMRCRLKCAEHKAELLVVNCRDTPEDVGEVLKSLVMELLIPGVAIGLGGSDPGAANVDGPAQLHADLLLRVQCEEAGEEETGERSCRVSIWQRGPGRARDIALVFHPRQLRFEEQNDVA